MQIDAPLAVGIVTAALTLIGGFFAFRQVSLARHSKRSDQLDKCRTLNRRVRDTKRALEEWQESRSAVRREREKRKRAEGGPELSALVGGPEWTRMTEAEAAYEEALALLAIDVISDYCPHSVRATFSEVRDLLERQWKRSNRDEESDSRLFYWSRVRLGDMELLLQRLSDPSVRERDKKHYAISGHPHPKDPWPQRIRLWVSSWSRRRL